MKIKFLLAGEKTGRTLEGQRIKLSSLPKVAEIVSRYFEEINKTLEIYKKHRQARSPIEIVLMLEEASELSKEVRKMKQDAMISDFYVYIECEIVLMKVCIFKLK